jgi:hypothetical protein
MYKRATTPSSVHKIHSTRRYGHPLAGDPAPIGVGRWGKVNFRFTEFSEVHLSHMGRTSTAPCRHNLAASSMIQRRPQEK